MCQRGIRVLHHEGEEVELGWGKVNPCLRLAITGRL